MVTISQERKRHLIEELRKGRINRLTLKEKKQKTQNDPSPTSASIKIRTRKITIGWMHCNSTEGRHVSVRATKGGGTRRIDLPILSTKDDIIAVATNPLFPNGVSSHGLAENMVFDIANFKGETISDEINNDDNKTTVPFTLEQYINRYKLVHVRIYLTSKPELEEETWSDIDDDILKPGPVSELQGISKLPDTDQNNEDITILSSNLEDNHSVQITSVSKAENHGSVTDTNIITNNASPNPFLIGTSDERTQLMKEQNDAYNQSLEEDRRKEKEKADLEKNLHRLEAKRAARLSRVPKEPGLDEVRVRVAVRHPTEGILIRYFPKSAIASTIYDWVGSCALEPENFKLCLYPGQAVDLFEQVVNVAGSVLYMEAIQNESDDKIEIIKRYCAAFYVILIRV